jgi:multicomponent Na+:H+ antiporter subunit G
MIVDLLSGAVIIVGVVFFTAGTIGLIRFPDTRSRLHALTKADNIGLGLVLLGVALQVGSGSTAVLLLITWVLVLGAASVSAQTLAGVEVENSGEVAPAGRGEST